MTIKGRTVGAFALLLAGTECGLAEPAQQTILEAHIAAARLADPSFAASAERGKKFFLARYSGGKADTPSCGTCHTDDPRRIGKTRAGKEIAPMAISLNPRRITDPADVAKWFRRNCSDVLGRECTAAEKSDFIAYLMSQ